MKKGMTRLSIMRLLEKNKKTLRKLGVKKIGLFGSYLHGTQRRRSDLDFLVDLRRVHFDEYMDLKFFLEKTFRKKVDLVIKGDLKPAMQYVKKEAQYAKGL